MDFSPESFRAMMSECAEMAAQKTVDKVAAHLNLRFQELENGVKALNNKVDTLASRVAALENELRGTTSERSSAVSAASGHPRPAASAHVVRFVETSASSGDVVTSASSASSASSGDGGIIVAGIRGVLRLARIMVDNAITHYTDAGCSSEASDGSMIPHSVAQLEGAAAMLANENPTNKQIAKAYPAVVIS